jgi:phosphate:Na+ symporter
MIRKIYIPVILVLLAFGFYYSPNFIAIAAGVSILLFGMIMLEEGFKSFTGGPLEKILIKSTGNTFKSISFGVVSTGLLQSSSLISVITISFISVGLVTLKQAVGIIFGANLGTTTGAWLISLLGLKISIAKFALPIIVFGFILLYQKSKGISGLGKVLFGIGLLFLGIAYMKTGFESYKESIDLAAYAIPGFAGLLIFTGIGIVATVIMQSSHATLAIILTALTTGQITYDNAMALAIGANIGTTITAIIASINSNIQGKRLALAHLVFNVFTGAVAIIFIHQIGSLVNVSAHWFGIAENDFTLKLSLFHTYFNTIGILLMLPLMNTLIRYLKKFGKEQEPESFDKPYFLNKSVLSYPQVAIEALLKESRHLFKNSFEIIAHALNLHREDILSERKLRKIINDSVFVMEIDIDALYFSRVKNLYSKIIEYASIIEGERLSPTQVELINNIKTANRLMVASIKEIKDLKPNINRYMKSDNEIMKNYYNDFRRVIAKIIREIYNSIGKISDKESLNRHEKRMKDLNKKIKKLDLIRLGKIDEMIRNKNISSYMATSLINDVGFVSDISKNLVKVSELLYINKDNFMEDNPENGNISTQRASKPSISSMVL